MYTFAKSLTFNPDIFWGGNSSGIPQANPNTTSIADKSFLQDVYNAFHFSFDPAMIKPGMMRQEPECNKNPEALECNTSAQNRSYVFPPQQLYSQKVAAQEGPTCNYNPLVSITSRQTNLQSEDIPRVYVTDNCNTITPEVGPTEPTRDTTYGKALWSNPVYTFPDVVDTESKAEGVIWDSQRKASNFFDEWHFQTFTKNSPDYIQYKNY